MGLLTGRSRSALNVAQRGARNIICMGDSITLGYLATTSWPAALAAAHPTWNVRNLGVSGRTLTDLATVYPTEVAPLFDARLETNTAIIFAATNDIAAGASAGTVETRLLTISALARASGHRVLWVTPIARGDHTGGQETVRQTLRTYMLANYATYADAISDPAALAAFATQAATADTAIYVDGTHPTDAGHALIKGVNEAALLAMPAANSILAVRSAFSSHNNGNNQTIATGTYTKLAVPTVEYDTDGSFDPTLNRWTPKTPGVKHLDVTVRWYQMGTAIPIIEIRKNGTVCRQREDDGHTGTKDRTMNLACDVSANGTDYFEVWVKHDSGSNVLIQGLNYTTYLTGHSLE